VAGVADAATGVVKEPTARAVDLHLTQVLRVLVTDLVHQQVVVAVRIPVVVVVAWLFLLTMADLAVRV
jgi:hypothetical protein